MEHDQDEEKYQEFCDIITQNYEALLEFNAYEEEAKNDEMSDRYRENALLHAFSAFVELYNLREGFQELFETIPIEDVESLEDLMLNTEIYDGRLQLYNLNFEGDEPDELEMAAINAVKHNYTELDEYDMLC